MGTICSHSSCSYTYTLKKNSLASERRSWGEIPQLTKISLTYGPPLHSHQPGKP